MNRRHTNPSSAKRPTRWQRFASAETGAITALWLLLLPAILLVGGFATDISIINAQKRYTQAQSDLAARSAVRLLPDLATARETAQQVVSMNDSYGDISLARDDITFGAFNRAGGFVPAADQDDPTGVNAIRVSVPSNFDPLLLSPVLTGDEYTIRREAVAVQRAAISFSLRNRLLSVDTSESILDPLLGNMLGLGATVSAVGYAGLANAAVNFDDFLGLIDSRVSADALTFEELLDASIATTDFVDAMLDSGGLPATVGSSSGQSLNLGSIINLSPAALEAHVGHILPPLDLNAFDLLMAAVSLNGTGAGTPLGTATVGVPLPPLADAQVGLALIRPAVMAVGFVDDIAPLTARVAQVDLTVEADLLSLLQVGLDVEGATAEATVTALNCGASLPSDTLASFDVQTSAAELNLTLSLLSLIQGKQLAENQSIPVAANNQTVSVRLDQLGEPVPIRNEIALSAVTGSIQTLLGQLSDSTEDERPNCGLLGCLVGSVLHGVVNLIDGVVGSLNALVVDLGLLDQVAQALLDLLGIQVAQADLILNDYSCGSALVR